MKKINLQQAIKIPLFFQLLGIALIALKLSRYLYTTSWFMILIPLWGGVVLNIAVFYFKEFNERYKKSSDESKTILKEKSNKILDKAFTIIGFIIVFGVFMSLRQHFMHY